MSILTYANGPGFEDHYEVKHDEVSRVDLSKWDDYTGFETRQPSTAPLDKETHSGTDVAIFATGLTIFHFTLFVPHKAHKVIFWLMFSIVEQGF
jgi:hypothetical protein